MTKIIPSNFAELCSALRDLQAVFPYGPDEEVYDEEHVELLVGCYISGVKAHLSTETSAASVAQDYAICERLLSAKFARCGELVYDGYCGVICSSLAQYLFQIYTHFLGEGLDGDDLQQEWARVRSAFIANGYATEQEIAETCDE